MSKKPTPSVSAPAPVPTAKARKPATPARKPGAAPADGKPAAQPRPAAGDKAAKAAPVASEAPVKGTRKAAKALLAKAQSAKAQVGKTPSAKSRPVLVRDSFTMPESDFALIARLKSTALTGRRAAKKSELLRAGLHLLAALEPAALVASLDGLEAVKTGRPKKGH